MSDTPRPAPLGFGLMRLPRRALGIDIAETCRMVDRFLAAGYSYFDTAHIYLGSEDAARKALVSRHARESFTLTTKLHAGLAPTAAAARKQLETSLRRTGAGYFDYYLLHSVMESNAARYDRFGLWDFVAEQQAGGLVRRWAFSYHGGPELLDRLLTEHPGAAFVQLQINYADWENPSVQARANYETARRHGVPVVIMEPVKGGALAAPPPEVRRLLEQAAPGASCASWALRFAAGLEGVLAVLSGMSTPAQLEDNLATMAAFRPLDAGEQRVIQQAQRLLGHSAAVPCTGCGYCAAGCPEGIAIPDLFAAANLQLAQGRRAEAAAAWAETEAKAAPAARCIGCGRCEAACPQHLPIPRLLKRCGGLFEPGRPAAAPATKGDAP